MLLLIQIVATRGIRPVLDMPSLELVPLGGLFRLAELSILQAIDRISSYPDWNAIFNWSRPGTVDSSAN